MELGAFMCVQRAPLGSLAGAEAAFRAERWAI